MKTRNWSIALILLLPGLLLSGCGSGNNPMTQGSTTVTVNFPNGTPIAVATRSGSGGFTSMSPSSQISLSLPAGTTSYAIAFVCPPPSPTSTSTQEHVIEATTQDSTSLKLSCTVISPPAFGTATGSLSSTISGTASFEIFGRQGFVGSPNSFSSGPFSVNLPTGTTDVAVLALDASNNIIGVKILPSQTVPGALNGGSGIIVSDAPVSQQVTVNNVPAGFNTPGLVALYTTANGTVLSLANNLANPHVYTAIPAAEAQSGDSYLFETVSGNPATLQSLEAVQTATAGGAVTLTLPAPWSFSGPSPAKLPTFTFNYSGFSGQPFVDFASLIWSTGSANNLMDVTVTANSLAGTTTISFPDLSAIPGFFGPAPSGTTVSWIARITSSTMPPFTGTTPTGASLLGVANSGQFTQP